jgi:uncharacterized membrane protein
VAVDLLSGSQGAVIGGWLLRHLHVFPPNNVPGRIFVGFVGAAALLTAVRMLRVLTTATGMVGEGGPAVAISLDERLKQLGQFERTVLARLLSRERWTADPNQRFESQATFGARVADRVASFGGSWTFIGLFAIAMISWMALNEELEPPFDPFPYILLNLALSCLAALQAPVIMMSQNRQAARDRSDARNDYEVNLRAEMEIGAVHAKLDLLREQEWTRLVSVLDEQQRTLAAMQVKLDQLAGGQDGR